MDIYELKQFLSSSWSLETCSPGLIDNWSLNNKALGQCAITALIVNDYFGGKIMRCMTSSGSHYYNLIAGEIVDLTVEQFLGETPKYEYGKERTREYLLSNEDTKKRYLLLKSKLEKIIVEEKELRENRMKICIKERNANKARNILEYYVLCNKLKNIVRTGWKDWNVKRDRIESVAEHIFGTQMLALAMYSEYEYDIDIFKVILMLSVHELEEIIIGDLTLFQITKEKKKEIGHEAVEKVLSKLLIKDDIAKLIYEFDEEKTNEALFAHYCDKLEFDLQSRLYDEEGCVDVNNQPNNSSINDPKVRECLDSGMSFSEMMLDFGRERYNYDDAFLAVSNYASNHKIKKLVEE